MATLISLGLKGRVLYSWMAGSVSGKKKSQTKGEFSKKEDDIY